MDADETTLAGNVMQTRMQVHDSAVVYRNMSSAISSITSTEGAARLWRGVFSVILGAGPAHAVHFGTYEFVKSQGRRSQMFNEPVNNGMRLFLAAEEVHSHASRYRFAILSLAHADTRSLFCDTALAGASATIAGDGFMNPFDGAMLVSTLSSWMYI